MRKTIFTKKQEQLRALLVQEREKAGLTQQEVARRIGVYKGYVSKYETGERRLDVIEFLEVAEAIGFDPNAMIKELRG